MIEGHVRGQSSCSSYMLSGMQASFDTHLPGFVGIFLAPTLFARTHRPQSIVAHSPDTLAWRKQCINMVHASQPPEGHGYTCLPLHMHGLPLVSMIPLNDLFAHVHSPLSTSRVFLKESYICLHRHSHNNLLRSSVVWRRSLLMGR